MEDVNTLVWLWNDLVVNSALDTAKKTSWATGNA